MEKERKKKKVMVKEKEVLEIPPVVEELSVVGKPAIRVDAYDKVMGKLDFRCGLGIPWGFTWKSVKKPLSPCINQKD